MLGQFNISILKAIKCSLYIFLDHWDRVGVWDMALFFLENVFYKWLVYHLGFICTTKVWDFFLNVDLLGGSFCNS